MANVHTIKKTNREVVLKIYSTESSGQTIQIPLSANTIKLDSETYVPSTSSFQGSTLTIKEIFWGAKKDKQIDLTRVDNAVANTVHGHYYLLNSGHYKFDGFVDNTYANGALRVISDGPFHLVLVLHKDGYT